MSAVSIRAALETALNAITPTLPIAWENVPFTPTTGITYQRATLLFAQPDNSTMGDNFYREQGFLQIDLCYPRDTGPLAANNRATLIRSTFKRGDSFIKSGIVTTIEATPEIRPAYIDGDFYIVPIRVRFFSNIS
jgi:hypothetical protein